MRSNSAGRFFFGFVLSLWRTSHPEVVGSDARFFKAEFAGAELSGSGFAGGEL
jgi:hypothetical protein